VSQPCCIPGRVLLDRCSFGKLILKPSHRSGGIDLYWRGDSLIGALDHMLHDTILKSWWRLDMLAAGAVPRPIPTMVKDLFWLCRLVPGTYHFEAGDGGIALWQRHREPATDV